MSNIHGNPNLVIAFSNRNHVVVSTVQSITSVASTHLVKYSVAVMMYLSPNLLNYGLIGPTNSMDHLSNYCNVTCGFNGISSHLDGFPTL
jgi:hypothetical protein